MLKKVKVLFIALLMSLIVSFPAHALADSGNYSSVQELKGHIETIDELRSRDVITEEFAESQYKHYAQSATEMRGRETTVEDVRNWNQFRALFQIGTFLKVIGVIAGLGSVAYLLGPVWKLISPVLETLFNLLGTALAVVIEVILRLLSKIPPAGYELLFAAFGAYIMYSTAALGLQFVGAAVFALAFSVFHGAKEWQEVGNVRSNVNVISGASTVGYGTLAVVTQSVGLGVLASMAFVTFFGFQVFAGPLVRAFGYQDEDKIAPGAVASGVLAIFGVLLSFGFMPAGLVVLQAGAVFCGAFVYLLSLLFLSSRWYASGNYWLLQVIAVLSHFALLWAGVSFGVSMLGGIAATFTVFYLTEKYVEFCSLWVKNKTTAGIALLLTSILCLGVAFLFSTHPELFVISVFT